MWQICGHIPQTLIAQQDVTCMAAKLSVSFFIETFIHAKEKVSYAKFIYGNFSRRKFRFCVGEKERYYKIMDFTFLADQNKLAKAPRF